MRNALWTNIFRRREGADTEEVLALKQVPIFADLTNRELKTIRQIVHAREYKSGEFVFQEDTPGLGMYIILQGHVSIKSHSEGKDAIRFAKLTNGDFFGEISLVNEGNRGAFAEADSNCKLLAFFRTDLLDLITRNPKLGNKLLLNLARVIGKRLETSNEMLLKLNSKDTIQPK